MSYDNYMGPAILFSAIPLTIPFNSSLIIATYALHANTAVKEYSYTGHWKPERLTFDFRVENANAQKFAFSINAFDLYNVNALASNA